MELPEKLRFSMAFKNREPMAYEGIGCERENLLYFARIAIMMGSAQR